MSARRMGVIVLGKLNRLEAEALAPPKPFSE
jgi:hypothetical protein